MTVRLSPQHEALVKRALDTGRYRSAEEVLDAALIRLEEEEIVRSFRMERLRIDIDAGIQHVELGLLKSFDARDMKRRVRESVAAMPRSDTR